MTEASPHIYDRAECCGLSSKETVLRAREICGLTDWSSFNRIPWRNGPRAPIRIFSLLAAF